MLAKIISVRGAALFCALALILAGCTPAGPRALLKGKKSLERGDFAAAAAQFKTATTLLATNANAWNYYGVALQQSGQPDDAATAYQRALDLNRDLSEAHFNLGNLRLEQNNFEAAKTEFTAYTLRRNNDTGGWLKLGAAQLKLGETAAAERSFSTVLALKSSEAEAYNGLGLARIKRNLPQEAVKFFAEAKKRNPAFPAAILNLATTSQQFLHDNKTALENYRAYLALSPRPANWDEVNAVAAGLEPAATPVAIVQPPPPTIIKTSLPPVEAKPLPKVANLVTSRPPATVKAQTPVKVAVANPPPAHSLPAPTTQVVSVPPAPRILSTPKTNPAVTITEPVEVVTDEPEQKPKGGFWHRVFSSSKKDMAANAKYLGTGVTPLPGPPPENHAVARPMDAPVAPVALSRYSYFSPRKPAAGDRRSASGAFTKARVFEQDEKWIEALQWYQQAAQIDPAWFEAQYNTGVLAHRLRNYSLALPCYEYALAIQPDSKDARYNFALALKAAGYAPDAAEEFKKILAADPGEVRAHLALANLYAQPLHDPAQARQHYLKVLELEPDNPQASDIRFWLSGSGK